jgi:hypothetical protein
MKGVGMKGSRIATIAFVVTVGIVGAIVALAQSPGPVLGAADRAEDALVQRAGSDCVVSENYQLAEEVVREKVKAADPGAGWVVQDRVYVGEASAAANSVSGDIVAVDDQSTWMLAGAGKVSKLYGLYRLSSTDKSAYVVTAISRPC